MPLMIGQQTGGGPFRARFIVMALLMTLSMVILLGRLYQLQVIHGKEYREKSIDNFIKEARVPADRGMILDHRGRILVDNRPSYNVTLTPAFCQTRHAPKDFCVHEVIPKLATYLALDAEETNRVIEQYEKAKGLERFRDLTVQVDVQLDSLDRVEANRIFDLPGVDYVAAPHRRYIYSTLAAHVLGYMNEVKASEIREGYLPGDYVGRQGVELRFESYLKGKNGILRTQVDAKGRKRLPSHRLYSAHEDSFATRHSDFFPKDVERLSPAVPGHNLILSLNLPLQQAMEKAFESTPAGAAVVLDVSTGFILAILSKPAFDPNRFHLDFSSLSKDPLEPLVFRAAQQHYHPGSTFKPITALAALKQGVITEHSTVFCPGSYQLGRRRWRCWRNAGHGSVDLLNALAWSCDTFFYALADRMGIDPIADMSRRFGLGHPPGLKLTPEAAGIVPSKKYHDRVTPGGYTKGLALNTAIGQGDNNLSPLQLAMVYSALANRGTLYRPQLVRRIETSEGKLVKVMQPVVINRIKVNPRYLQLVNKGLWEVVNRPGGTAYSKRPKELGIEIAGKTGTAQVVAIGKKRVRKEQMSFFTRDHAWFAAFAPYRSSEIAVVVLNEHGGHGGSAAGPIAMEIIKAYFRIKKEDAMQRSPVVPQEVIPQPAPSETLPSLERFPRKAYSMPVENQFWN